VNKLGDPSRKLASDAAFLLGQLLLQHPAMKMVVVREVRLHPGDFLLSEGHRLDVAAIPCERAFSLFLCARVFFCDDSVCRKYALRRQHCP